MIIWFINLYNFLDGINGYMEVKQYFSPCNLFYLVEIIFLVLAIVAVLGFYFWNWNKAKIFMGDVEVHFWV